MSAEESSFAIERANFGDRADVVRLFGEDQDNLRLPWEAGALGAVYDHMVDDPHMVVLVAREPGSGRPVGVLVASRVISVRFGGRSLWLEVLYVTPSARRNGLGRALVDDVMDLARDQGFRGIDLEAYHGNAAAGLLYRSMGFRRLGRERFNYAFEWEDETE